MFQITQVFQVDQVVVTDIHILQELEAMDALNMRGLNLTEIEA